jgi:3-hydroxybutyrate dehydrogenase
MMGVGIGVPPVCQRWPLDLSAFAGSVRLPSCCVAIGKGWQAMSLKGKVALVTGSTSGIGLGIARALGAAGADLVLNGFGDPAQVEALRRGLAEEFKLRVLYSGADMSKPAEIAAMVAKAREALGAVDILVNNAGIQHVANIEDFPEDKWDAIIAVNLSAVFHATKAAIPGMKAKGWGRIINIASAHGLVASGQKVAYVAAKHAVVGMTKVTAIELANHGVTANAICPGWVRTPLVERQLEARAKQEGISVEDAKRAFLSEKQPMAQFSTPEDIGALAVFLSSDAARTITGAPLSVDGGWVAA